MRLLPKIAVAALCALAAAPAAAQFNANLTVHADVIKNCVVTTTDLEFNDYDPIVANSTVAAAKAGVGAVNVACTKTSTNESFTVELDGGANFDTTRRMWNGTDYLNYDVLDATNAAWPAAGVTGTPGGLVPVAVVVNGSIPGAQDVSAGSYTDTLLVTVTY